MQFFIFSFFILIGFFVGFFQGQKSWDGYVTSRSYVQGRGVAGEDILVKQARLSPEIIFNENNIIKNMSIENDLSSGFLGLKFGNYLNSATGLGLCSVFSDVEVILQAEGMGVSGEIPQLVFMGKCPGVENPRTDIKTNFFPLFDDFACKADSIGDSFSITNGTQVLITHLDNNIAEAVWIVKKIEFYQANEATALSFSSENILDTFGKNFRIECPY